MTMPRRHLFLTVLLVLLASLALARPAFAEQCEQQGFEEAAFIVCTVHPGEDDLRLFWKDAGGRPYRHFSALAEAVAESGRNLAFAINAGMYQTDFSPNGLYVEEGRELRPINTRTMEGSSGQVPNFYKQPNGVFTLGDEGAGILPTEDYVKRRPEVRFATQSGPLLVIDNEINPIFIPGSTDRTRRDGVGVCEGGVVRFVISESAVNFHDFARLFRDHLQCPNALFLDGGRGVGLYSPELGRNDFSWHGGFGPMLGLVE
ncbi:MAG: hypothetical protein BGO82_01285 [Devosia sp. 67-54]|uniref:phosphodiester glycosidase family protein n=1 Tax=unclassified Devosia TaxID=196773 RepID=UPI00095B53F3|nr:MULTISPECIES: phosphodiester glycosidase family protein [unclassified Devosia]MBN9305901.1 phosphodiester glycosidase family protein [Devosia sp.]OJX16405.1 MAG: hypothetical protein BGO82_01285 [Devosia sp. 67-54]